MEQNTLKNGANYFAEVEDFRMEKKCLHKLSDILFIGLLTSLSNGEDFEDNAPENLSTMKKMGLQIISQYAGDKLSLKKRRMKAAYDQNYLKHCCPTKKSFF